MKWILIVLLFILFLLAMVALTRLTIIFTFDHENSKNQMKLVFKAWAGLVTYKKEIPSSKGKTNHSPDKKSKTAVDTKDKEQTGKQKQPEDILNNMNDAKEFITHVVNLNWIIRRFLRKVTIKQMEWHTVIGAGDAAHTGFINGAFWTAKGAFLGLASHYMVLKDQPEITITPHFQQSIIETSLTCMFQFRIGYAMLAGIRVIKFWKGGRPNFKSKPLSVLSNDKTKSV